MSQRLKEVKKRKQKAKLQRLMREADSKGLDRRKHWGMQSKIDEYSEAVTSNIDLSPLEEVLNQFSQENVVTESLFDRIVESLDFKDLFKAEMVDELQEIVTESFKKGGSRVLTEDGDSLSVAFDVKPERIIDQLKGQEIYLKNLGENAREKTRDIIVKGAEEGKSIGEMQDEILNGVEDMTEARAETIARSEVVKASSEGTDEAMEQAGIDEVVWDATINRQTCDKGSFSVTVNGTEYTSCRELNGVEFDRGSAPKPVSSSHPNCRCALLAITD